MEQIEIFISGASLFIAIIALIQTWRSTLKTHRLETFMQKNQILSDIKTFVYKHNYYSAAQDLLGFQPSENENNILPQDLEDQILMCFGKTLAQQFHKISSLLHESGQIDYYMRILIATYRYTVDDYQTLLQNLLFDNDEKCQKYLSNLKTTIPQDSSGITERCVSYVDLKKAQNDTKRMIEEETNQLIKCIIEKTSIA